MNPTLNEVASAIQERFGLERTEFREQITLFVAPERIVEVVRTMQDEFGFNILIDETAVDY